MTYNPWRDAAERYPGIHIERGATAPCHGAWVRSEGVVFVGEHLDQAERRAVLAHELAHMDCDHFPTGDGRFDQRAEDEADQLAARRLVELEPLAMAVAIYPADLEAVAAELWVPAAVVECRIEHMHPSERGWVTARIRQMTQHEVA